MKKNIDFNYENNHMGALSDTLIDKALVLVGDKLSSDPAQKEQAIQQITDVVKQSAVNNAGLIFTSLFVFGLAMAACNVAITTYVLRKQ